VRNLRKVTVPIVSSLFAFEQKKTNLNKQLLFFFEVRFLQLGHVGSLYHFDPRLLPNLETIVFKRTIGLEDHFLPLEIRDYAQELANLVKPLIEKMRTKKSNLSKIVFCFRFSGFDEVIVKRDSIVIHCHRPHARGGLILTEEYFFQVLLKMHFVPVHLDASVDRQTKIGILSSIFKIDKKFQCILDPT